MVWRGYGWVGESEQFWSTLGFISSSVFLGLISCRQVLRLAPDIWSRSPQSKSSTLPATLPPSQHYTVRRASLPGSRSTNFMASFLPSTTGSGRSGHTPLRLNPRQLRRRVTPTARVDSRVQTPQRWPRKRTVFFARKRLARATLHCTCAKPIVKAKATGLWGYSYRKNETVSSREKRGVGERQGLGALPGKQPLDLWRPLRWGEKAEQQKFRPGSEPAVKSNNCKKMNFYILI